VPKCRGARFGQKVSAGKKTYSRRSLPTRLSFPAQAHQVFPLLPGADHLDGIRGRSCRFFGEDRARSGIGVLIAAHMLSSTSCDHLVAYRVVFKVKDRSAQSGALHLVIRQAKRRTHWHLFPSHRVAFDGDRSLQRENGDDLRIEVLELRVL
jgi:hypothetical protein